MWRAPHVAWLAAAAAAGCGDDSFPLQDAGLDKTILVCPRPDVTQLRLSACPVPGTCADVTPGVDDDEDGASEAQGDCDDGDRFVGPTAREVCDLRDNDCDGEVDEGACQDPLTACPLDFAAIRCCGATYTIGGSFYQVGATEVAPMEVVVRRRSTGELRRAVTCPAIRNGEAGVPYRFRLSDPEFVHPAEDYELIIHLHWYFPAVLEPATCVNYRPVVTTHAATAATCIDYGPFMLPCL